MSDVTIVMTDQGLQGLGEVGKKAYARWRAFVASMSIGETARFSWHEPRNPKMHGLHFALLSAVHDAQEQFPDPTAFRMWVQVGAGLCDLVPGPKGNAVAIPRSISFEKMDEGDFQNHHEAAKEFLRSAHATRFLWPMLDDLAADARMNELIEPFER